MGRTGGGGGGRGILFCSVLEREEEKKSALNLKRTPGEGAGYLENVQLFPFADFVFLFDQNVQVQQK